jgi:hypothetical protein
MDKIQALEKSLEEMKLRVSKAEATSQLALVVMAAHGIRSQWLSPSKAAIILSTNKKRLYEEIESAERLRVQKKKGDCTYGVHYRNDQTVNSSEPTWKVNVLTFGDVLAIPPDQRKLG